jgi:tetratricopeptide (TPR) repeat protein
MQLVAQLEYANDLVNQGKFQTALEVLQETRELQALPGSHVTQAVCWLHLDRPAVALCVCDRALKSWPQYPQLWLFRGVALHRLGRYKDAYAAYAIANRSQSSPSPVTEVSGWQQWLSGWLNQSQRTERPVHHWTH